MIFAILTLLSALTVAGVSGWFSIVGVMSIYAGAPLHAALVMGVVLEGAKLVTTSWLYRNWAHASWKLKIPLIYFTAALMIATSIGVFGFLTKAHLEQGASTIDNTAKVERLDQQIAREKALIADNEKVISQLDTAINSFLGNDKTDRALAVRRAQAPQRKQLRDEIQAAQKQIDVYSEEKLKLTSEVRALQLEVGPIRYIAELFYGTGGNETAKVETAVRIFTLLIVSTLDPLAVILLIAANHSLLRRQNEKDKTPEKNKEETSTPDIKDNLPVSEKIDKETDKDHVVAEDYIDADNYRVIETTATDTEEIVDTYHENTEMDEKVHVEDSSQGTIPIEIDDPAVKEFFERGKEVARRLDNNESLKGLPYVTVVNVESDDPVYISDIVETDKEDDIISDISDNVVPEIKPQPLPVIISPSLSRIEKIEETLPEEAPAEEIKPQLTQTQPWAHNEEVLAEILGNQPHFVPIRINEKAESKTLADIADTASKNTKEETTTLEESRQGQTEKSSQDVSTIIPGAITSEANKYPKALSWLKEFKGD